MFNDDFLEKVFNHEEAKMLSVGSQAIMVHIFEEILNEMKEGNKDATISELFE